MSRIRIEGDKKEVIADKALIFYYQEQENTTTKWCKENVTMVNLFWLIQEMWNMVYKFVYNISLPQSYWVAPL